LPLECELDPADEPTEIGADPERRAASRELGARVAAALKRLAPDRRRAAAAHLQGFEVAEIMAFFGWSYERARNLIARGVADLRRQLESESDHERP
jgi:DNA-directed RNA polymerase specialized sigma24 family protein